MKGTVAAPGQKSWPKVHLIYFILAMFDLIAVGGGLYLSYRLSSVFEESIATNDEWSRRFVSFWNLNDLVSDVNGPGNEVFQTKNLVLARANFTKAAKRLAAEVDASKLEISQNLPAEIAEPLIKKLSYVDQALSYVEGHGRRTLTEFEKGDLASAVSSLALMNKSSSILRKRLNEVVITIRDLQGSFADVYRNEVASLKRFEYVLGGSIILIVCCVVAYGHWVGTFMTRKYLELKKAHENSVESETEARQLNLRLQSMNEDIGSLNRELRVNLAKLAEAQDELVRKGRLSQLGQLTATVAHELRNPMGAVRTSAFVLDRKLKGKGLGVEQQIDRINNGVTRCDTIITQLLDFARTKTMHCEARDFDAWLLQVVEEEAEKLPQAVTIEVRPGLDGRTVEFDPARLARVLINLLSNASEAMVGKGDKPEKFATQSPVIAVETGFSPRGIAFSVTDNGPGITPENLKKILEPLFTTKNFGTGLGLPAVEKILEQHGGGLEITSRPGEGACFRGWLPLAQTRTEAA